MSVAGWLAGLPAAGTGQAGVAGDLPDAQVVVGHDVLAPLGLDAVVAFSSRQLDRDKIQPSRVRLR
jgi:hypothetical protein